MSKNAQKGAELAILFPINEHLFVLLKITSFLKLMSSRGRGRGGVGHGAGASKPGRSLASGVGGGAASGGSRPKTPGSIKELGTYLHSLNDSNFPAYGDMFAEMVLGYSKRGKEQLQEAVELIFDTTVQSREYAALGAKVCEKIVQESTGDEAEKKALRTEFRKLLFLQLQGNFKNKETIRVQSVEAWLGIFAFMCELSPRIIVAGKPFLALSKAILSTIEFLLSQEDVLFDEIDCICSSLKVCGKGVEEQCSEKFNEIFTELRKKLIFGKSASSCQVRCAILELIEYRYLHWSDPNNTLLDFYADAMADADAADTLEGQKYYTTS